ncbi:MFS transporter [Halobacillus kuroshimensis]|uniref:MFS transporter n=1 Tax=Halobacillus kuroshimensis TaxID=302481 RepID=A0ABS3E192_9BACI|nr:MFS transporter [Halobacillus kuroshimensis]MBN8237204.1 MFS transporter [Halobacillus kuroshimensis]
MKKTIGLLTLIQFFVYIGFGIIIPVIPELINNMNGSAVHIGWLLAVYSLASFLTARLWGSVSDQIGRRKVLLVGLLGFTISFLMFAMFIDQLTVLYVSRIIGGLFAGALYTGSMSYVADITTKENRNKYMGFVGMAIGLGFIFGPAIGGLLSKVSLSFPFYISAILMAITGVFTFLMLEESKPEQESKEQPMSLKEQLTGNLLPLFAFTFVATLLLAGLEGTFQVYQIQKIDITPFQVGLLFMVSGLIDAAIQGGVMQKIKDGTETHWIIMGQVVSAGGLLLMPLSFNLWYAGLFLVIFTAGNALVRTCTISLITKKTPRHGAATGTSFSLDSLGRVLGPVIFTWIFEMHTLATFLTASLLGILSVTLIIAFEKQEIQANTI